MSTENPLLTMIREVCALGRAELDRPHTPRGDPSAQRTLVSGLLALDPDGNASDISLSLSLLAPRAPYFDGLVLEAISAGIPQVINLGARYDDRALRFRSAGVTFFELDLPHVVTDKTRRLDTLNADLTTIRLAAIDFAHDDLQEVLTRMGYDSSLPALFIAEHLALFLQPADVDRLMRKISAAAAPGSRLAFTAETHPEGLDPVEVTSTVDTVMFSGHGPLHTILPLSLWQRMLLTNGWTVTDQNSVTVDHFPLPIDGNDVQIQTRFITATR